MSTQLMERDAEPAELSRSAGTEVAMTRAAQEVQAAMAIAKRFPRDEKSAYSRLMNACKRKGLAEAAIYEYPRGGTKVEGPSIRLAEAAAQCWGNVDFGVVELEQKAGESTVMAYAWDLETNTRQTKIFQVKHERHTKQGRQFLSDPRDIYEMVANQGARRLRACILGVIPGDVIDDAVNQCDKTLAGGTQEPIGDRVRKMLAAFAEFNVTVEMVESKLGHKADAISESELAKLRKTYTSIKDGMGGIHDFFPPVASAKAAEDTASSSKSDAVAKQMANKSKAANTEQSKPEPVNEDLKPYWFGVVSECKDAAALDRKHSQFQSVKKQLPDDDQLAIENAFEMQSDALKAKA